MSTRMILLSQSVSQNLMAIRPSLTNIMTTKKLRFRHLNALGMAGDNSFACLLELPWIFLGAPLKINGAPCSVQGGLTGMQLKCWYYQMMGWKLSIAEGRGHRFDELVTVVDTVGSLNDNLWCHQCFRTGDVSLSVMVILNMFFLYVYFVSGCNEASIWFYLI